MFTGLIETTGTLLAVTPTAGATRITIAAPILTSRLNTGDSIAVNGVCLTALSIEPNAFQFKKGNRIRIDLANGDSGLTEFGWFHHEYTPDKRGQDTIFHSEQYPSQILLPLAR